MQPLNRLTALGQFFRHRNLPKGSSTRPCIHTSTPRSLHTSGRARSDCIRGYKLEAAIDVVLSYSRDRRLTRSYMRSHRSFVDDFLARRAEVIVDEEALAASYRYKIRIDCLRTLLPMVTVTPFSLRISVATYFTISPSDLRAYGMRPATHRLEHRGLHVQLLVEEHALPETFIRNVACRSAGSTRVSSPAAVFALARSRPLLCYFVKRPRTRRKLSMRSRSSFERSDQAP
jgi:hypothetical protein